MIRKIVSGGQTGADRAALDAAMRHGIPHGGWCPRGRKAEDGPIDRRYLLRETPGAGYIERTERNVRDSDGTVVLSLDAALGGGSLATMEFARNHRRPHLHLSRAEHGRAAARRLREFVEEHGIGVLNVAGPRESTQPGTYRWVLSVMEEALVGSGTRVQLKRALSKLGLCSRSRAEALIRAGKVEVNGRKVVDPLAWVDLAADRIWVIGVAGKPAVPRNRCRIVVVVNKPRGCVTTRSDERGRPTVYDLLPPELRDRWLFPVGRLDLDSEGMLLFTDDGPFADRLTDPSSHVPKTYRILLSRDLTDDETARFESGLPLGGVLTRPAGIVPEGGGWQRVTLTEGRNRQVRRMMHALGHRVRRLVRVAIGSLPLGDLPPGGCRVLGPGEVELLLRSHPRGGAVVL